MALGCEYEEWRPTEKQWEEAVTEHIPEELLDTAEDLSVS